jgi:hypothetical protein
MSLELANTLATLGTFVVIAATAIAALLQLRHARSSNQIAALNELRETTETPAFLEASHFVQGGLSAKLQDPAFRYQVAMRSVRTDETRADRKGEPGRKLLREHGHVGKDRSRR